MAVRCRFKDLWGREMRERDVNRRDAVAQERAQTNLHPINTILEHAVPITPIESGIYFLILDGSVVYVGQSRHVDARIASHMLNQSWRPFDSWTLLSCPAHDLIRQEAAYIDWLQPPYNSDVRSRMRRAAAEFAAAPHPPLNIEDMFLETFNNHDPSPSDGSISAQQENLETMAYLRAMKSHKNLISPFMLSAEEIHTKLVELGLSTG